MFRLPTEIRKRNVIFEKSYDKLASLSIATAFDHAITHFDLSQGIPMVRSSCFLLQRLFVHVCSKEREREREQCMAMVVHTSTNPWKMFLFLNLLCRPPPPPPPRPTPTTSWWSLSALQQPRPPVSRYNRNRAQPSMMMMLSHQMISLNFRLA